MQFALLFIFNLLIIKANCLSDYHDPHFKDDRTVIVQMLEWRFEDIAIECEKFLGPYGFGGVQTSPVSEHVILNQPPRPWYERYQPISYKLVTRSGNEQQFKDMVSRCNKAGVRIYIDVVLNHMSAGDMAGKGTAGSEYDGTKLNFPGVPFTSEHFNGYPKCPNSNLDIKNYDDPNQARNCRLLNLVDVNNGHDHVRNKQAEFLNKMINIGVAGFRVDASKHMWPADLKEIINKLHHLNTEFFPANSKPFFYHEVIYYGGNTMKCDEYLSIGRCIEFKHPMNIGQVFRKMYNQKLKWFRNWGKDWGMINSDDALAMIDSHDLQRGQSGHLDESISFFDSKLLKMSTAFMLAWPYGVTRIMSSYQWPRKIENGKDVNSHFGPPCNADFSIKPVIRNADLTCSNGWVCEHRWRPIYNMVKFRNIVGDEPVANWWNNTDNQIAFSRGNKGFIAINNDNLNLNKKLKTSLPKGVYCDIISGNLNGMKCSGRTVTVESNGEANILIDSKWEDPVIAIHVKSKLS